MNVWTIFLEEFVQERGLLEHSRLGLGRYRQWETNQVTQNI